MTASLFVSYAGSVGDRFDFVYYSETHMPLVKAVWAPVEVRVLRGVGVPGGGEAVLAATCEIVFPSRAALDAALAHPRTPEVFADVARFTDIAPVAQISEPLT